MARQLTHSGIVLPVIRKVICRDDNFVCSICRSEYKSKVEANNCLNHCWYDVQKLYPVVLRKLNARQVVFRCHFCCRDYRDETDALQCAHRCQSDRNQLHVHEQILNDLPIEAPTHRPSRIRLVAMKAVPRHSLAKAKKDEPKAVETHDIATAERAAIEMTDGDLPRVNTPELPPRKTKAAFPKPWVRMDAKYQCSYCRSQFFTKMETEACFTGHFDAEGFEIPVA